MDEDFDIPPAEEMNEDLDLPDEPPIMKVGEEKEIGKEGLKKKLVKEGEGWDRPDNGDEVEGNGICTCFCCVSCFFVVDFYLFCCFCFLLQCIIRGHCWMGLSLIRVATEELRSSSPLVKVID